MEETDLSRRALGCIDARENSGVHGVAGRLSGVGGLRWPVELEKAWPALTQLRRASPYPGQRKVALVGEASLSASAGMPFAYDEVLEALTRS